MKSRVQTYALNEDRAKIANRARLAARAWAEGQGVPDAALADVELALGEAVNNACEHAKSATRMHVVLSMEPGLLRFIVYDNGEEDFDPLKALTRERVPHLGTRGRGLLLMRSALDGLEVRTGRWGTLVRGEKRWS